MGGVRKMPEYIERDECRNEFYESVLCILSEDSTNDRANQIIDAFDDLPTADVQPVKCGRWMCGDSRYPYCSECRRTLITGIVTEYCPRCGAKMNKNGR